MPPLIIALITATLRACTSLISQTGGFAPTSIAAPEKVDDHVLSGDGQRGVGLQRSADYRDAGRARGSDQRAELRQLRTFEGQFPERLSHQGLWNPAIRGDRVGRFCPRTVAGPPSMFSNCARR